MSNSKYSFYCNEQDAQYSISFTNILQWKTSHNTNENKPIVSLCSIPSSDAFSSPLLAVVRGARCCYG